MSVDHHDLDALDTEPPKRTGLPPVAKYVCGAAFALSASLAIPFFYAKSRAVGPKTGVHISKRAGGPGAALLGRPSLASQSLSASITRRVSKPQNEPPADTLGAIKHAFKALGAATLIVGTTTGIGVLGVMVGLGITTIGEFHTLMRSFVRSSFPELNATLHSVPDTAAQGRVEVWDKQRVDKVLEEAYEKGGVRAWMVEARRQLERERAVAQKVAEWQSQNRISLSYFSYPDPLPDPTRPTLLFLAAFVQRADVQFIPQLRDASLTAGFNFVGIDVHGHGDTTGRDEWGYVDNAKDVADGLTLLGIDKFFVLGASHGSLCRPYPPEFGTYMREVLLPAWISSVPPPDTTLVGSIKSTLGVVPKRPDEPGSVFGDRADVQASKTKTAEDIVGIELLSKIVDNWRTHVGEMKVQKPVDVILGWGGSETRLGSVVAPVLILHGKDDSSVPVECADQIFSALPKNELTR
ncbi:hypothetical protein FRC11_004309, partial [Ceratobasidium sp. 423]